MRRMQSVFHAHAEAFDVPLRLEKENNRGSSGFYKISFLTEMESASTTACAKRSTARVCRVPGSVCISSEIVDGCAAARLGIHLRAHSGCVRNCDIHGIGRIKFLSVMFCSCMLRSQSPFRNRAP